MLNSMFISSKEAENIERVSRSLTDYDSYTYNKEGAISGAVNGLKGLLGKKKPEPKKSFFSRHKGKIAAGAAGSGALGGVGYAIGKHINKLGETIAGQKETITGLNTKVNKLASSSEVVTPPPVNTGAIKELPASSFSAEVKLPADVQNVLNLVGQGKISQLTPEQLKIADKYLGEQIEIAKNAAKDAAKAAHDKVTRDHLKSVDYTNMPYNDQFNQGVLSIGNTVSKTASNVAEKGSDAVDTVKNVTSAVVQW